MRCGKAYGAVCYAVYVVMHDSHTHRLYLCVGSTAPSLDIFAIGDKPYWFITDSSTANIRQRMYHLISSAYTTIEAEEFATYVGLQVEPAIAGEYRV